MTPESNRCFAAALSRSLESGEELEDSERSQLALELTYAVLSFDTWLVNGSEDEDAWGVVTMTSK